MTAFVTPLPSVDLDDLCALVKADPDLPDPFAPLPGGDDQEMDLDALVQFLGGDALADDAPVYSSASYLNEVASTSRPHSEETSLYNVHGTSAAKGSSADGHKSADKAGAETAGKSRRRRRVRTAKQQELNRLAQQRYRERKKEKYTTLKSCVDELANQVNAMKILEAEKAELEVQNGELRHLVDECKHKASVAESEVAECRKLMSKQEQKLQELEAAYEQQTRELSVCKAEMAAVGTQSLTDQAVYQQLVEAVRSAVVEGKVVEKDHNMLVAQLSEHIVQRLNASLCRTPARIYVGTKKFAPVVQPVIQVPVC